MSYNENKNSSNNIEENNLNNNVKGESAENTKHKKGTLLLIIPVAILWIILIVLVIETSCVLGHDWQDATCESPKICKSCEKTEGEPLGHNWTDADCENPKTCATCSKTDGDPLGHTVENWTVQKVAACADQGSKEGICSVCNKNITEAIPETGHSYVDNSTTKFASENSAGEKTQKCTKCGNTISVSYYLSDKEKANINLVKNGTLQKYPSKTVGEAFANFFSDPLWHANGNYVVFGGRCTWNGEMTKAAIGFKINGNTFELDTIEIGDISFNSLAWTSIMNTIYSY